MGKFKKNQSASNVLSEFTEEIGKASKSFMHEFTEAVNHNPVLSRQAESFAYAAQTKAGNLEHKIGKGLKYINASLSDTSAIERETGKLADTIEHSAGNLAEEVDRFARKKLSINLEKIGQAFGHFFEKFFDAIASVVRQS